MQWLWVVVIIGMALMILDVSGNTVAPFWVGLGIAVIPGTFLGVMYLRAKPEAPSSAEDTKRRGYNLTQKPPTPPADSEKK